MRPSAAQPSALKHPRIVKRSSEHSQHLPSPETIVEYKESSNKFSSSNKEHNRCSNKDCTKWSRKVLDFYHCCDKLLARTMHFPVSNLKNGINREKVICTHPSGYSFYHSTIKSPVMPLLYLRSRDVPICRGCSYYSESKAAKVMLAVTNEFCCLACMHYARCMTTQKPSCVNLPCYMYTFLCNCHLRQ